MKQLKKFILWLIGLGLICIIGISNVFGATTKTIYPNTDFSQNSNNYLKLNESGTFGITNINTTIQGISYGFNFYMQENVVLNKTYTIVITFMADDLRSDFQNNYVHVNVGSGSTSSSVSIVSITRNNPTGYSTTLTIKFNPLTTGDYIQVNLISDGPPYQPLTGVSTYGIRGVTLDSSADTQDIINNQNQNTQDIINAQQSSASSIINNQNQNTQDIIESQLVCKTIDKTSASVGYYINSDGDISSVSGTSWGITDFINIVNSKINVLDTYTSTTLTQLCFYNVNKVKISCTSLNNISTGSLSIPTNAEYLRTTIQLTQNKPILSICQNGSQALSEDNKEAEKTRKGILGKLGELISNLFDTSGPDTDSLNNMVGWLPAGPVDSIINLPLILYNSYLNALTGTCQPLHIHIPFLTNQYIDIPCISTIFSGINGLTAFWTWVGIITSVVILYRYLISLYQYYDKLTTLQANFYDDFGGAP